MIIGDFRKHVVYIWADLREWVENFVFFDVWIYAGAYLAKG